MTTITQKEGSRIIEGLAMRVLAGVINNAEREKFLFTDKSQLDAIQEFANIVRRPPFDDNMVLDAMLIMYSIGRTISEEESLKAMLMLEEQNG